jgi:hypothetical protein
LSDNKTRDGSTATRLINLLRTGDCRFWSSPRGRALRKRQLALLSCVPKHPPGLIKSWDWRVEPRKRSTDGSSGYHHHRHPCHRRAALPAPVPALAPCCEFRMVQRTELNRTARSGAGLINSTVPGGGVNLNPLDTKLQAFTRPHVAHWA